MNRLRSANNLPAKGQTDGLMTEAHAKDWHARPKLADHIQRHAGLLRPAGAGRNYDAIMPKGPQLVE